MAEKGNTDVNVFKKAKQDRRDRTMEAIMSQVHTLATGGLFGDAEIRQFKIELVQKILNTIR